VPLVRVKLNGTTVLMALDTGAGDLLVDQSFAKRCGISPLAGESAVFWNGGGVVCVTPQVGPGRSGYEDTYASSRGLVASSANSGYSVIVWAPQSVYTAATC
jgi:hypothetical protein